MTTSYQAPLRDIRFVLHELLDAEASLAALPGFEETDRDVIDPVLDQAAKFCENVLAPLNHSGDREGCSFINGEVRTPRGFVDAYRSFVDSGWNGLAANPEFGGQGLPQTVGVFVEEMLQSSNMAFAIYVGLTHGALVALERHADEDLRRRYLPKLIEGRWTGVMCLTESHCGTDLGLLRTRAEPTPDGRYRVHGTKIFITGGEHDLSENIVHFVLARLPDAPPGVKGISMFLVPKYIATAEGDRGERNAVHCSSIEHKMGIHGASTCVMQYEGATGYLIGEPHRGLRAMFSMMNYERLLIGQQGLAQGEVAYQKAVAYARDRLQGRSLKGAVAPESPADPIIVHPDIRRMLLTARAWNEGSRALIGWITLQSDRAARHPDPQVREAAQDHVDLLTPVLKAFITDCGFESCNLCLQVLGGHGYISEWGMEQLVRDARIAQIYEGANGIQALDLVGRKLPMHGGRPIRSYIESVSDFIGERGGRPELEEFLDPLAAALSRLEEATTWLQEAAREDPDEIGSASYDYLRLLGLVAFAKIWAESAEIALARIQGDNSGFYRTKIATARFFMRRLLPTTASLLTSIRSGADALMALEAEAF